MKSAFSNTALLNKNDKEFPKLDIGDLYDFEEDNQCSRIDVEWTSTHGLMCDLDLGVMCFDERGRFIEKLSIASPVSRDESCTLVDIDSANNKGCHLESVVIDFSKVDISTACILLCLDGGPRNFQFIQGVTVTCEPHKRLGDDETFLSSTNAEKLKVPLFRMYGRTRKDYQGIVLSVIYKDGWSEAGGVQWSAVSVFEPIYCSSVKEKEEKCTQTVVIVVPALEKFKPRLFVNVRAICTALSSLSLPKLKKNFFDDNNIDGGLMIGRFCEVVFKQLYETHPKIIESSESAYLVAMLQEMFHQIDFNGDTTVDWDEFTTFCIQTGLVHNVADATNETLDEYVIEYGEELLMRDRILSPHRFITQMRYIAETKRILVIPEDTDSIFFFDEKFHLKSNLYPTKLQVIAGVGSQSNMKSVEPNASAIASVSAVSNGSKIMIYDVVYITGRDLYAYCCSDHTLNICKEQTIGAKCNYVQYNRFYHALLHLRLCWSERSKVLCSVASDKVIYGWDIDADKPIFQISRHNDLITDMIAIDNLELFATCSLDKRIVLWSSSTKRVKGVLLGHKRGVRCLSSYENILLSAGFECEAKLWDLVSKDLIGVLRGHRRPIAGAKLMCVRSQIEEEQRAITVDEGGEFRLWNIFIKERAADAALIPTLQIFEMNQPESPINRVRFLAVVNDPRLSTSYYSDLVACSTKLLHFIPEKNSKEFVPPTACIYNDAATCIVTAVGKSIMKYDICTGHFTNAIPDVSPFDLTALCLDGERGRRIYIGCSNGDLYLMNFTNGLMIDKIQVHHREITSISAHNGERNTIYTGSLDGRLRMLEEDSGKIHIHNTIEDAFGESTGIDYVQVVEKLGVVIAVSNRNKWGLWNCQTFKKIVTYEEDNNISACVVIGVSGDKEPTEPTSQLPSRHHSSNHISRTPAKSPAAEKIPFIPSDAPSPFHSKKEKLLTVALAVSYGVLIYTVNAQDVQGVASYLLKPKHAMYITRLRILHFSQSASMNYTATRGVSALSLGSLLIGTSDFGQIVLWEIRELRRRSESMFRKRYELAISPKNGARNPKLPLKAEVDFDMISNASAEEYLSDSLSIQGSSLKSIDSYSTASELPEMQSAMKPTFATEVPVDEKMHMHHHDHNNKKTIAEMKGPAKTEHNAQCINASQILGIAPDTHIIVSTNLWKAHLDSIITFVEMEEHGCIVSVSLDGYHRVWNLDGVCLGEMPLPNITDVMKKPPYRVVKKTGWKFILERIPVTAHHIKIATQLVSDIIENEKKKEIMVHSFSSSNLKDGSRRNGHSISMGNSTSFRSMLESSSSFCTQFDEKNLLSEAEYKHGVHRHSMLKSLTEPLTLPDDAPPSSIPKRSKPGVLNASSKSLLPINSADSPKSPNSPGMLPPVNASESYDEGNDSSSPSRDSTCKRLWGFPGELKSASDFAVPAAFSEHSLFVAHQHGVIDGEGYRLLRNISKQSDKIDVYDRSQSVILLRNPALSTVVKIPAIESCKKSEVNFGEQKDMYQNACKDLKGRDVLSSTQMRHMISLARIEQNVRKVHSMVHVMAPRTFDDVVLPKNAVQDADDDSEANAAENRRQMRLSHSASLVPIDAHRRPLDKSNVSLLMNKVDNAMELGDRYDEEMSVQKSRSDCNLVTAVSKVKRNNKEKISAAAREAIEKKLLFAINFKYNLDCAPPSEKTAKELLKASDDSSVGSNSQSSAGKEKKLVLNNRALLPFYKMSDIRSFLDVFNKSDEDFTGDLDINEWVKLFASLSKSITSHQAKMLFMQVDTKAEGILTFKDIVPIVFHKADKIQLKLICTYFEGAIAKNGKKAASKLTLAETEQLFDCYEVDNIGFVSVAHIRERIRALNMGEAAQFMFMERIADMEEDEMVNTEEFIRIFKPYISGRTDK